MELRKIIKEQVGLMHLADAVGFEEYYGKIVDVELVLGGVAVTYENGNRLTFIRRTM